MNTESYQDMSDQNACIALQISFIRKLKPWEENKNKWENSVANRGFAVYPRFLFIFILQQQVHLSCYPRIRKLYQHWFLESSGNINGGSKSLTTLGK